MYSVIDIYTFHSMSLIGPQISSIMYIFKSKFSTKVTMSLLFNYLLIHKIRAVFRLAEYEEESGPKSVCSGNTLGRGEATCNKPVILKLIQSFI